MEHEAAVRRARGVAASVLASLLFGGMFFLSGVVDASPEHVFGVRILITAALYAALLSTKRGRALAGQLLAVLRSRRWMPLAFVGTAGLVGVQLWLFAWAPVHGHALDASLGYLLLPIVLVAIGRLVFAAPVSRAQWVAVGIAGAAVALQLATTLAISWVTVVIAVGYALYFTLRKRLGLDGPAAFGCEVVVLAPVAILLLVTSAGPSTGIGTAAVLAIALAGAVAMTAYLAASSMLPLPLFGLLTYLEPVLLFVAAILLGERLDGVDVVVYALLAIALAVLGVDGFRAGRRR